MTLNTSPELVQFFSVGPCNSKIIIYILKNLVYLWRNALRILTAFDATYDEFLWRIELLSSLT